MRKDTGRIHRISALLMRELAVLIQQDLQDPRASRATLTAVDVAPDLSHAKVFVTHMEGKEHAREIVTALSRAGGFLRHRLAKRVKLRVMPELRFVYDESVEKGVALSALIDKARAGDRESQD